MAKPNLPASIRTQISNVVTAALASDTGESSGVVTIAGRVFKIHVVATQKNKMFLDIKVREK